MKPAIPGNHGKNDAGGHDHGGKCKSRERPLLLVLLHLWAQAGRVDIHIRLEDENKRMLLNGSCHVYWVSVAL